MFFLSLTSDFLRTSWLGVFVGRFFAASFDVVVHTKAAMTDDGVIWGKSRPCEHGVLGMYLLVLECCDLP